MKTGWKNVFPYTIGAFLLFLGIYYWKFLEGILISIIGAAKPVIIGFIIAYTVNILMSFYERHYFKKYSNKKIVAKTRRAVCMVFAMLTLVAIIGVVVGLVIPELVLGIKAIIADIPPAIEKLLKNEFVLDIIPPEVLAEISVDNLKNYAQSIVSFFATGVGNAANAVLMAVTRFFSTVITAFISIIFAIYLLLGKEKLKFQCVKLTTTYLKDKWKNKVSYFFDVLNQSFKGFIVGQCTEAVILGALCVIGMYIFRFPYATTIGMLIGFTALVPVAGAYIGAFVGAFMILTVSPVKSLLFLVFIVVLQQLEGNLIYPKVVGKSLKLPALLVLAAVTVGGGLFGVIGMLVGVPLTAAVYRIICDDIKSRNK